jgi:hypothetical protein
MTVFFVISIKMFFIPLKDKCNCILFVFWQHEVKTSVVPSFTPKESSASNCGAESMNVKMVMRNFKAHIMNKILAILLGTSFTINWAVIQLFILEFPFTMLTPKCYCLEIKFSGVYRKFLELMPREFTKREVIKSSFMCLTCMFQELSIQFGFLTFFEHFIYFTSRFK